MDVFFEFLSDLIKNDARKGGIGMDGSGNMGERVPQIKKCSGTMKTGPTGGKYVCNNCGGEDYHGPGSVPNPRNHEKPCTYDLCAKCGQRYFPSGPCKCWKK